MNHQEVLDPTEQERIQPPAYMQEQIHHITGQLAEYDKEVFLDAISRYGLARIQAGEKAIGEMGNQIRESEVNSEEQFDKSHDAVDAWTAHKSNALWRARDEAVNELLYEHVPMADPRHAAVSPTEEIQKSADEFLIDRVKELKEKAARILNVKVDAALPNEPDGLDEEDVALIGMFDLDESVMDRLDALGGLLDNAKPKNIGRTILRKVSGQPVPETWTSDDEISAAIREFTATIDQVKQNGVNDAVKEGITEHLTRHGLLYPSAEVYANLTEEAIQEAAYLFDPGTTKKAIIDHLEAATISMLRDMGYVTDERKEPIEREGSSAEVADQVEEFDPAVLVEIDQKIAAMRAEGIVDKKIFRMLSREYHPDISGLPREYFQHLESRFRT